MSQHVLVIHPSISSKSPYIGMRSINDARAMQKEAPQSRLLLIMVMLWLHDDATVSVVAGVVHGVEDDYDDAVVGGEDNDDGRGRKGGKWDALEEEEKIR